MCVCVCACVFLCVCVRAWVYVCVCVFNRDAQGVARNKEREAEKIEVGRGGVRGERGQGGGGER